MEYIPYLFAFSPMLMIGIVLFQICDGVYTQRILEMGGTERNPIVRETINLFGNLGLWLWKIISIAAGGWCLWNMFHQSDPSHRSVAFIGLVAIFTMSVLVFINNSKVYIKMKGEQNKGPK